MKGLSALLACAALAFYAAPVGASVPPPLPRAEATFDVGSLHVQQYGTGAQTVIFIPGLTCGPWEWSGQIALLSAHYTIYALTLPGMDGQPAISGPLFQTATADFWRLLDARHVIKPVVIGHSLGGTMAFMLATQHPERLAGAISVDGLPLYPGDFGMSASQISAFATQAATQMESASPAQFAQAERSEIIPNMVTAQSDVDAIAPLVALSDPAAAGRWFQEDILLDLRPSLPKANVPILLIAPFDGSVDARFGATTMEQKRAFYARIVNGAPDLQIAMIDHSRHFAMYDQPQAVNAAIVGFLGKL